MLFAPRNGIRDAPRWLEQGWTKKSWDAASLADPKVICQHFVGIRESCNLSDHIYRRKQHRYFSHILDMAPWPSKLFRRALERGDWLNGPWERACWNPATLSQEWSLHSWGRIQIPPAVLLTTQWSKSGWRDTSLNSHDVFLSNEWDHVGFYSWHGAGCPQSLMAHMRHTGIL